MEGRSAASVCCRYRRSTCARRRSSKGPRRRCMAPRRCIVIRMMPSRTTEAVASETWPALPLEGWRDTYATLHMWTQVVGKLALELSPLTNHYWNTALQVTPRGLATLPLTADHRSITISFDFVAHQLVLECSGGKRTTVSLEPRSVAEFYRLVTAGLTRVGIPARMRTLPAESPNPSRFDGGTPHRSY